MGADWHSREGELYERFGLLDPKDAPKYRNQPIFQKSPVALPDRKLTAIGLTSGIGSMLIGAHQLGFKVVGNIEWRDYYRYRDTGGRNSFASNFPGSFMARGLHDVPLDLLPDKIDFAAGHPECGLYSMLAHTVRSRSELMRVKRTDAGDIPLFLHYVSLLRPRFFLMDDLPDSFAALPMERYVELLPDYDLFPEWISNWGYGNVQKTRNRMFMVGALKKEKFIFRANEHAHQTAFKDIIGDMTLGNLPNHMDVDRDERASTFTNLRFRGDELTWGELREVYLDHPEWQKRSHYYNADGLMVDRPGSSSPTWEGHCPVLTGGGVKIQPMRLTPMTIRERARVQGFPDDFVIYHGLDPYASSWSPFTAEGARGTKQTGKSMPIQFCKYVAKQIRDHINGKQFDEGHRILKPNPKVTQAKMDFCRLQGYHDQALACARCWHREKCDLHMEMK